MAAVYANQILDQVGRENALNIEKVPERWKDSTLVELARRGYDGYGKKL